MMTPKLGLFLAGLKRGKFYNLAIVFVLLVSCRPAEHSPLHVEMPLHLEEHLDDATITGSEVPEDLARPVTWYFDEPQPDWRPATPRREGMETVEPVRTDDALRLPLTPEMRNQNGYRSGSIFVDLPDWTLEDWAYVEIRARTHGIFSHVGLSFNYVEVDPGGVHYQFYSPGDGSPLVSDGTVQTYRLSLNWDEVRARFSDVREQWEGPWTQLAVWVNCPNDQGEAALDILSISVVPVEAQYAGDSGHFLRPMEWHFDEPQPEWGPVKPLVERLEAVTPVQLDDALQLPLAPFGQGAVFGMISVEVPDLEPRDWAHVEIRARTPDLIGMVSLAVNLTTESNRGLPFEFIAVDQARLIADGTVQTYRLSLDDLHSQALERPWTHLGIWFQTDRSEGLEKATVDILSARVIPREAGFATTEVGAREIDIGNRIRRALYTHAPSRVEYRVRVPEAGRLDVGLGVLRRNAPVTFRVEVRPPEGDAVAMLEESYSDTKSWGQRSVDLTEYAGRTVTLGLEADAESAGTVAFWGAPTVSGSARVADRPNVVFYIIDGAGAEYMSLYGYNRRTTPNIDRLASEGAVFERAYSNSSWTRPSTASFMTSLQHSALGGERNGFNVVPENVLTMAQHLHRAGHQTAVFTGNPNAGKLSGLDREVDFYQEHWPEIEASGHWRESSRYLHEAFWRWRGDYPGEPYWVHFQTDDIHHDFPAVAPFGGLFVSPDEVRTWEESDLLRRRFSLTSGSWPQEGISRVAAATLIQGLYDESMAHNDYQLGRLVERLKAEGEWENTLLIVASDHSIVSAVQVDMAMAIQDSLPPQWHRSTIFRPSTSRIPLLFVWPDHIPGGQRFSEPFVSMIDVLPTVLDLAGLPPPEAMQGQSLAPLLLGLGEVESRPVILDEFVVDPQTGDFLGTIEVVDGRWGASLELHPDPGGRPERQRPVPLLLYDLWNDPNCLRSVHEEWPDLVEKYTTFLEEQFEAHQALAKHLTQAGDVVLTPEQLEMLRTLGYIR